MSPRPDDAVTGEPDDDEPTSRRVLPSLAAIWPGGLRRQAYYILTWLVVIVGFLLVLAGNWRKGLVVIGSGIALAGVLRLLLPTRMTGWLAVRNRTSDVTFCALIGAALIATAILARE